MPPTIDLFVTSILSNPAIRGRHERVRRGLTSLRIAYSEHDVAADDAAKSLWKRKARNGNELPFLLVDGELVGSVEEFDDAVEFGELRQFLRLDAPPATSSAAPAAAAPVDETPTDSTSAAARPSIDDFASLSLSPSELDELAREIASGSTFSSGLGTLTPLDAPNAPAAAPLNFSHATRTIEPVLPPTAPLKFERVNFTRPLPDRPLASDVARDELEGIETGDLGEDELDKLARELEEEEEERRRLRDAQGPTRVEPPPLPEKPASVEPAAVAATTKLADPPVPPKLPADLAGATAVGGAGGAALSAPLVDVATLRLSPHEQATLASPPSPGGATLEVQPVSALERAGPLPEQEEEEEEEARAAKGAAGGATRTSKREADEIRAELNLEGARGGPARVSEMPHFGAQDLSPPPPPPQQQEEEGGSDELVENVAAAIRGGDL
ncbi:hypothetical protein JCM8208_000888 [Rhodotorula glutinis]